MGKPKAITIQNEMGMIREVWKWGMTNTLIPFSPKLPFHNENLITDDRVRRDTWEASEWSSFARKVRDWLNTTTTGDEDYIWDAFVSYQMLFFLANNGMRVGEVVKVRRKDIRFFHREGAAAYKSLCALVQVHPSTKTWSKPNLVASAPDTFARAQQRHAWGAEFWVLLWVAPSSLRYSSEVSSTVKSSAAPASSPMLGFTRA